MVADVVVVVSTASFGIRMCGAEKVFWKDSSRTYRLDCINSRRMKF